jgi:hypothetical protein
MDPLLINLFQILNSDQLLTPLLSLFILRATIRSTQAAARREKAARTTTMLSSTGMPINGVDLWRSPHSTRPYRVKSHAPTRPMANPTMASLTP